jgi:hypothetical protein
MRLLKQKVVDFFVYVRDNVNTYDWLVIALIALEAISFILLDGCAQNKPTQTPTLSPVEQQDVATQTARLQCRALVGTICVLAARCHVPPYPDPTNLCMAASATTCMEISSIRDVDLFLKGCLPVIEKLTCEELNQTHHRLPEACVSQFK